MKELDKVKFRYWLPLVYVVFLFLASFVCSSGPKTCESGVLGWLMINLWVLPMIRLSELLGSDYVGHVSVLLVLFGLGGFIELILKRSK